MAGSGQQQKHRQQWRQERAAPRSGAAGSACWHSLDSPLGPDRDCQGAIGLELLRQAGSSGKRQLTSGQSCTGRCATAQARWVGQAMGRRAKRQWVGGQSVRKQAARQTYGVDVCGAGQVNPAGGQQFVSARHLCPVASGLVACSSGPAKEGSREGSGWVSPCPWFGQRWPGSGSDGCMDGQPQPPLATLAEHGSQHSTGTQSTHTPRYGYDVSVGMVLLSAAHSSA